jgi:hypothetical protein
MRGRLRKIEGVVSGEIPGRGGDYPCPIDKKARRGFAVKGLRGDRRGFAVTAGGRLRLIDQDAAELWVGETG